MALDLYVSAYIYKMSASKLRFVSEKTHKQIQVNRNRHPQYIVFREEIMHSTTPLLPYTPAAKLNTNCGTAIQDLKWK